MYVPPIVVEKVNPDNEETETSAEVKADPLMVKELAALVTFKQILPNAARAVVDKVGFTASKVA